MNLNSKIVIQDLDNMIDDDNVHDQLKFSKTQNLIILILNLNTKMVEEKISERPGEYELTVKNEKSNSLTEFCQNPIL